MGSCFSFLSNALKFMRYDNEGRYWVNMFVKVDHMEDRVYDEHRRCWVKPEA